jgi:hypothetical protein
MSLFCNRNNLWIMSFNVKLLLVPTPSIKNKHIGVSKNNCIKEFIKSHSNTRLERNHIILVLFYYFPFFSFSFWGTTTDPTWQAFGTPSPVELSGRRPAGLSHAHHQWVWNNPEPYLGPRVPNRGYIPLSHHPGVLFPLWHSQCWDSQWVNSTSEKLSLIFFQTLL